VVEAWRIDAFRDEVIYALCRSVSKNGTLQGASDWLGLLAAALPCPLAVELYAAIRDGTERSESEWQPEFERAFPACAAELPPVDQGRELSNKALGLFLAVGWDDPERVRFRLSCLRRGGFEVGDAVLRVSELRLFPEFARSPALAGLTDTEELSAVRFAERLGHHAALAALREPTQ
jgi:hypothetical protein